MNNTKSFFMHFLFIVLFGFSGLFAQNIEAVGKNIATDKQGNNVYQVDVNGITIGYKLIGSGEPLVMIMGLGGTMNEWPKETLDILSQKYQLVLLDNRGMGYSTANDTEFSYKLFANDVLGLMDKLSIEKADVLGFSMGSVITQQLLITEPQRFKKAIIYASSTDGYEVTQHLQGKMPDNFIVKRQYEASIGWKTPMDKLALVKNQVMFIIGTGDSIVGVEPTKAMASAIPGAWMIQFKNGQHTLMIQAPKRFAKTVLLFLEIDESI